MANLVTLADIKSPIRNMVGTSTATDAQITQLIPIFEREFMEQAVGGEFYELIGAATIAEGDRYYKLLNGEVYTITSGETFTNHFRGLKDILCDFIYMKWIEINEMYASRVAVVAGQAEGNKVPSSALICSISARIVQNYGHISDRVFYPYKNTLFTYLDNKSDVYPEIVFSNFNNYTMF